MDEDCIRSLTRSGFARMVEDTLDHIIDLKQSLQEAELLALKLDQEFERRFKEAEFLLDKRSGA